MPVRRHLEIKSSNIKAVGYDPEEKVMEIIFQTDPLLVYKYPGVDAVTFATFVNAESVGGYFAAVLRKGLTKFEKVRLPPPPPVASSEQISKTPVLRTGTIRVQEPLAFTKKEKK